MIHSGDAESGSQLSHSGSIPFGEQLQVESEILKLHATICHGFHCGQLGFQVWIFQNFPSSNFSTPHIWCPVSAAVAKTPQKHGNFQDIPLHLSSSEIRCQLSLWCLYALQTQNDSRFKTQCPQEFNSVYHITVMQCLHSHASMISRLAVTSPPNTSTEWC